MKLLNTVQTVERKGTNMKRSSRTYTCPDPIRLDENGDYVWDGKVLNGFDSYFEDVYQANREPLNSGKRVEDIVPSGDVI